MHTMYGHEGCPSRPPPCLPPSGPPGAPLPPPLLHTPPLPSPIPTPGTQWEPVLQHQGAGQISQGQGLPGGQPPPAPAPPHPP